MSREQHGEEAKWGTNNRKFQVHYKNTTTKRRGGTSKRDQIKVKGYETVNKPSIKKENPSENPKKQDQKQVSIAVRAAKPRRKMRSGVHPTKKKPGKLAGTSGSKYTYPPPLKG